MVFNLKNELVNAVKNISWNFVGILDSDKKLHPIPKNLNFQALFERLVLEKMSILNRDHGITIIDNENIRSYPDMVLKEGVLGKKIIALDVKTGRRENSKTGFTLGSYAGYFRKPTE